MTTTKLNELRHAADDVMDAEFVLSEKRRRRDELVIDAAAEGASLRVLADAAFVSHQTIANILDRAKGATSGVTTTAPAAGRDT